MVAFLNFITAIFWGQLSHCDSKLDGEAPQYSCSDPTAYGALAAFAVLLFLVQVAFTACLVLWRGELIREGGDIEDLSGSSSSGSHSSYLYNPLNQVNTGVNVVKLPPSADL